MCLTSPPSLQVRPAISTFIQWTVFFEKGRPEQETGAKSNVAQKKIKKIHNKIYYYSLYKCKK